jgi:asparagine synthetase B (glutamine-hydrolysing)
MACGQRSRLIRNNIGHQNTKTLQHPHYYSYQAGQWHHNTQLGTLARKLTNAQLSPQQLATLFQGTPHNSSHTLFSNINRVPLGTSIKLLSNGKTSTQQGWPLATNSPEIELNNDAAYLHRFTELLHEAISHCLKDAKNPAMELSGGLDSSSIFTTCHQQGKPLPCYMHISGKEKLHRDDSHLAKALLKHFNHQAVEFIDERHFNLWQELEYCAEIFSGPAPIILPMLSQNIWRRVAANGHDVLLSGAGGDHCVSSHAKDFAYIPALLTQHGYFHAWQELQHSNQQPTRNLLKLLGHSSAYTFHYMRRLQQLKRRIRYPSAPPKLTSALSTPRYFKSLREQESYTLQGALSHNLQMRIEYSQMLCKSLGFEIRYPLLYPPLLDFCHRLPLTQKRRLGITRFLLRRYLAQYLPEELHNKKQKQGGIIPATLELCQQLYQNGELAKRTKNAPYNKLIQHPNPHREMANHLFAYMLKISHT